MNPYKAKYLSPMIPSYNLQKTANFFITVLEFEVELNSEAYMVLRKGTCMVHLLKAGENIGQMECYLEIEGVEALWKKMEKASDGLRLKPIHNREYGMREIHIELPFTKALLFIGEYIK